MEVEKRDHRTKKEEINIDMNPMVDLAFLLLTFFMLTTTFSKPQAMEIVMPLKPKEQVQEEEQPIKESRAVTILLGPDDRIYYYRGITDAQVLETDYSNEGVRELLFKLKNEIDEMVLLVKPMQSSVYENLVDILDELQITGVQRFAMVQPEEFDLELLQQQGFPIE